MTMNLIIAKHVTNSQIFQWLQPCNDEDEGWIKVLVIETFIWKNYGPEISKKFVANIAISLPLPISQILHSKWSALIIDYPHISVILT